MFAEALVVIVAVVLAEPEPEPERSVTLAFGGDVMLGRIVNATIRESGPRHIWGDTLPLLNAADATLVNLECVIAAGGEPFRPRRVFYFRGDPGVVEALTVAGIDYVSMANNHAMDYRAEALLETIRHLDEHGIAHAGAGATQGEAAQPALLEAGGLTVGIVAFADHFRQYAAGEASPGTNVIEIDRGAKTLQRVRDAIRAAREQGAEFVVFSIHWGPNMRQAPSPEFVAFARAVMDAGADVFHGHSAHLFQGVEIYKGKVILFDTGDLIDDYYVDPQLRNDRQMLFVVTVTDGAIRRVDLVPLRIDRMQVNLAQGETYEAIRQRMRRLSKPFGTEIRADDARLWIDVSR
ncbi:MAG: CapA family protein [Planctomycetota bacterium]|jgi:poly-gamma-glutamate synthesis protein (capsule biosynthesis protein)